MPIDFSEKLNPKNWGDLTLLHDLGYNDIEIENMIFSYDETEEEQKCHDEWKVVDTQLKEKKD